MLKSIIKIDCCQRKRRFFSPCFLKNVWKLSIPTYLLQDADNFPGIRVSSGASPAVAGRSRHPDVDAGNEGIFPRQVFRLRKCFYFRFWTCFFPPHYSASFPISLLRHSYFITLQTFFFSLLKTGIKMPMNVSWRSASIIQRLWGTERCRPRHFVPVTADEEAICLRSVSRLLSQICFLFFLLFPPQLHLHTFLGERDEDSVFFAVAGGTNCSRSDSPSLLSCQRLGVGLHLPIGDVFNFSFNQCIPVSLPAAASCSQWLTTRSPLLLPPSLLMSIMGASLLLREGRGLWAPWHHSTRMLQSYYSSGCMTEGARLRVDALYSK